MIEITLNRLDREQVRGARAANVAGAARPCRAPRSVAKSSEKTDGVPLFVEELTKMLLESDLLREEKERYVLTGPLSSVAIPTTLQDSLMARLDRLPRVREVAQVGSVFGREFDYEMLAALDVFEKATLDRGLEKLVEGELLYRRGRPPRARYVFKHALIRDAAYGSLLRSTRQRYHERIAHLLEERSPSAPTCGRSWSPTT